MWRGGSCAVWSDSSIYVCKQSCYKLCCAVHTATVLPCLAIHCAVSHIRSLSTAMRVCDLLALFYVNLCKSAEPKSSKMRTVCLKLCEMFVWIRITEDITYKCMRWPLEAPSLTLNVCLGGYFDCSFLPFSFWRHTFYYCRCTGLHYFCLLLYLRGKRVAKI